MGLFFLKLSHRDLCEVWRDAVQFLRGEKEVRELEVGSGFRAALSEFFWQGHHSVSMELS